MGRSMPAPLGQSSTEDGLRFELRDGSAPDASGESVPVAAAQPLSAERTAALLERVPALDADPTLRQDFSLRPAATPAPRTGATVQAPWPPADERDPPAPAVAAELTMVRAAPEGEVEIAPHLSLSFSQPMVAVTTQEEAAKTVPVPVTLTPEPAGQWRWVGSKTLLFQPDGRFPMATEYTATVPAGTRSALGATLDEAVTVRFATPPPRLERREPQGGPHDLVPVLLMTFDQAVDAQAVLQRTTLHGSDNNRFALNLVDIDELDEDHWLRRAQHSLVDGRWVALQARQPLPKASTFRVELAAGLPSMEGPRLSTEVFSWSFQTFPPLSIESWHCGWQRMQRDDCDPEQSWQIEFNNPLDAELFDTASISVEPAVDGLEVVASGNRLHISGLFAGRTRYSINIPASLQDRFRQTLGQQQTLQIATGDASPRLIGPGKELVVLDPMAAPALSVYSRNLESLSLEIQRVGPEHWDAMGEWTQRGRRLHNGSEAPMPGTPVARQTLAVSGEPGRLIETSIPLAAHLDDGFGHLLLRVRPADGSDENRWQDVVVWVQSTRIGLVAVHDESQLVAWASALADGAPLEHVDVTIHSHHAAARTDAEGLARLDLPLSGDHRLLVATRGKDSAILPRSGYMWGPAWQAQKLGDELRWLVFDDRGMYRPGEEVRIKGWMRRLDLAPRGDLQALDPPAQAVRWTLFDSRGVELEAGSTKVSALGGFDLAITLPDTPNLGYARLDLRAEGVSGVSNTRTSHGFQIQEFRRPEYEVVASAESGPFVIGDSATLSVNASYYAGGALASAPVEWSVTATPTRYVPPNRSDWSFGTWIPWWRHHGGPIGGVSTSEQLSGKTDPLGNHHVEAHFFDVQPARPSQLQAQATVTDVNRQAWSATTELLVHPSAHYVGLRTARTVVPAGLPVEVQALVVDIDGAAVPGSTVTLELARLSWENRQGSWQEVAKDAQRCSEQQRDGNPIACKWTPPFGGQYRVQATVMDGQGRPNVSELRFWVPGGDSKPSRDVDVEELVLVPDRESPVPGDIVEVLVQAPFAPAEGLMTLSRGGILEQRRFALDGSSATLRIEITDAMVPGVTLEVAVVGSTMRTDDRGESLADAPPRPAAASGQITFEVPPVRRTLDVGIVVRDPVVAPGADTVLDLVVRDTDGNPVADAELAVIVADESVLALSGYTLPDPLAVFYAARGNRTEMTFLHPQVTLAAADGLTADAMQAQPLLDAVTVTGSRMERMSAMAAPPPPPAPPAPPPAPSADGFRSKAPAEAAPAIALRTDFSALALFAPAVRTGADGSASLPLQLPDSLTRFRVMVVAVAGPRSFGAAEAAVTVRQPLMLRPSPPRFLNFGDQFELPVVVQNQTDQPMQVDVAVRALNVGFIDALQPDVPAFADGLQLSTAGRTVTVPANNRVEVRFPAAAQMAGRARFQAVAASSAEGDAQQFELPVWTPATTEAFATYGSLAEDDLVVQPVYAPADVWPQFGGLDVTTSSTELQALTDAVLYLVRYPFDCSEQIASRVLAIAALRDVLTAFDSRELPSAADLDASVAQDLDRLAAMQRHDGGWGFWSQSTESWPYLTIHVANAFARAEAKGYPVPSQARQRALGYLQQIERHLPAWYDVKTRRAIRAYALDVRRRMGDADAAKARALVAEVDTPTELPIEAIGWLLPTLHDAGDDLDALFRHVHNHVAETAAAAHFVTGYGDQGAYVLLHTDRRTDGVMLEALLEVRPQHELIEKLVRGLLGHRVQGRWSNTQENAFILLGMDRYFHAREGVTPDFVARVWLDQDFAGEHPFRGRSTERFEVGVPMDVLAGRDTARDLVLQKDGTGRMYYRIGLRYAPRDLSLAPADHGFAVERRYEGVDDAGDVTRDDDGTWRIRAGAKVKVTVTMVAVGRRNHVALVDPIPAGLEPVNPALAVSENVPTEPGNPEPYWWWRRPWYEHQNMRDERVEAFASLLWPGVHSYSYVARATTPGRYVVPPPKAEEMYHPETFGRGATDRVVVE